MQSKTPEADISKPLPHIVEIQNLVGAVQHLLVHSENTLDEEDAKSPAETLEYWLESYLRGLSAAEKLTKQSDVLLDEMRKRLTLALEETQRWNDEGGAVPVSKEQKQRLDEISGAIRRIDQLIASINETFSNPEESKPEIPKASTKK